MPKKDFVAETLAEVQKTQEEYSGKKFDQKVCDSISTHGPIKDAIQKVVDEHILFKLGKVFLAAIVAIALGVGSRIGEFILKHWKVI